MEKKKIESRTNQVLTAIRYVDGSDGYVDAVRLARFFGFQVEEKALMEHEDGSVNVSEDGKEKYIVVNDNRSFESKRFIITHELAHYLLHYIPNSGMFMHRENKKGKNLEENDADYMAACLLMPAKSFAAKYKALKKGRSYDELISALQSCFRTPRESIERRIREVCRL